MGLFLTRVALLNLRVPQGIRKQVAVGPWSLVCGTGQALSGEGSSVGKDTEGEIAAGLRLGRVAQSSLANK